MPHEALNARQVAKYLHLALEEVEKQAARGNLPGRKVGGQFQFRKSDIDHYVERRMHELSHERLAQIERGVTDHHGMEAEAAIVMPLIPPGGVVVPLAARTRDAVLRGLVAAGEACGLVYDAARLLDEIRGREELCPTAIAPGVALPHPRHPCPYDIAASLIIVGRTSSGIPFGAADGSLTRLFFLLACKDDRTHLHVLARLSRMLEERTIEELMAAEDAEAVLKIFQDREQAVLAAPPGRQKERRR